MTTCRCGLMIGLAAMLSFCIVAPTGTGADAELAPLPLKLPAAVFQGTPTEDLIGPYVEKPTDKLRAPFMAPKGIANLAAKKKVSSSDKSPITGGLDLVTDGDKEASDTSFVELHRKTQWVQIDLGEKSRIYAVVIWHAHNAYQVYHDVVVQVADDPDFTRNVKTIYNNDYDNSSGLGVGTDKEYLENFEGRLMDAKGVEGQYLRCYSKGSTYSALNRYIEIEVWGSPAK